MHIDGTLKYSGTKYVMVPSPTTGHSVLSAYSYFSFTVLWICPEDLTKLEHSSKAWNNVIYRQIIAMYQFIKLSIACKILKWAE